MQQRSISPTVEPLRPPYAKIDVARSPAPLILLKLEVASDPESRQRGLSNRESLPEDSGMVFVFPTDQQTAFWMKGTSIPLSIAFIEAEGFSSYGRIIEIQDMQPMSEDLHRPAKPYRFALEVNQRFFKENGVKPGDQVEFYLGDSQ